MEIYFGQDVLFHFIATVFLRINLINPQKQQFIAKARNFTKTNSMTVWN